MAVPQSVTDALELLSSSADDTAAAEAAYAEAQATAQRVASEATAEVAAAQEAAQQAAQTLTTAREAQAQALIELQTLLNSIYGVQGG